MSATMKIPISSASTKGRFYFLLELSFDVTSTMLNPACFLPAKTRNFSLKSCQLILSLQCSDDHPSFWKS